jgi:hypothetical protein
MLENIRLENVLFLDIETVPQWKSFTAMPDNMQALWEKKSHNLNKEQSGQEQYQRAGIYAEFGKIICISVGMYTQTGSQRQLRLKSFSGHDEKQLLQDFAALLNNHFNRKEQVLCAHNGKEFDFPYIARRMLINGIKLPTLLDIAGKKPWDIAHIDTLELWKFGDYKSYTSLNLLAAIFDIPTPKDDIDGSEVAHVYWEEQNLERIAIYCQKDVLTVAQLILRFKGDPLLSSEECAYV